MTIPRHDGEERDRASDDASYKKHRRRMAQNASDDSREGRDIGELPEVVNPQRKEACRSNLEVALRSYWPEAFPLAFSADQKKVIKKIERAILQGGLFALAMPRGSGKTTICERAVMWAVLYSHHIFALLIAADQAKAKASMEKIKLSFETNALLLEDFPEVVVPIRKLERIANRAKGQLYQGQPTHIAWSKETIVLPTIPGSKASGAILKTGAILSAVRGANHTRPDGTVVRPTLALLDDPQTRASARSLLQIATREQIVAADVLGLAGPGQQVTALMPCTVIERGDMADRILDRALHPDWQGERMKMLEAFPTNMARWQEYRELIAELLIRDASPEQVSQAANKFYRQHRAEMDAGGKVTWEERKLACDVSALQSAMNLFFKDQGAFFSEYQNEPQAELDELDNALMSADAIARRVNQIPRGQIPLKAHHLTAYIDVHKKLLYWMVCWWTPGFTGGVVDYGTWPEQGRKHFSLRDAQPTLQQSTGRKSVMAAVRTGLEQLINKIAAMSFQRPDGVSLSVERGLVDANWGHSTNTVHDVCREHTSAKKLFRPAHGKGIKPGQRQMSEWKQSENEKAGHHWYRRPGRRGVLYVTIDTNYWKTFIHDGLALSPEEPLSLSLFKASPFEHHLLAEHLVSESRKREEADGGRYADVWKKLPAKENHFFDCFAGCAVAASEGPHCKQTATGEPAPVEKKKKLSTQEIRERREARRRGAA